jgi:hypothetical protein
MVCYQHPTASNSWPFRHMACKAYTRVRRQAATAQRCNALLAAVAHKHVPPPSAHGLLQPLCGVMYEQRPCPLLRPHAARWIDLTRHCKALKANRSLPHNRTWGRDALSVSSVIQAPAWHLPGAVSRCCGSDSCFASARPPARARQREPVSSRAGRLCACLADVTAALARPGQARPHELLLLQTNSQAGSGAPAWQRPQLPLPCQLPASAPRVQASRRPNVRLPSCRERSPAAARRNMHWPPTYLIANAWQVLKREGDDQCPHQLQMQPAVDMQSMTYSHLTVHSCQEDATLPAGVLTCYASCLN